VPKLWPLKTPKAEAHAVTGTSILSLLDDADKADVHQPEGNASAVFDNVMSQTLGDIDEVPTPFVPELEREEPELPAPVAVRPLAPVTPLKRRAPEFAHKPGDIVVVFGLRDDAKMVAEALQVAYGSIEVIPAGMYRKGAGRHIEDRRDAFTARADGVRTGRSFIIAVGLGTTPTIQDLHLNFLTEVTPDQVWLSVDVTRKPEDTSAWAHTVAQAADGVDAIAAVGVAETTTPETTDYLGIPVGWVDHAPNLEAV